MLLFIVWLAITGLVVGALGRLFVLGPDPMSIWETMALGLAASAISFVVVRLAAGPNAAPGIVLTVFVASVLVFGLRRYRERSLRRGQPRAKERR